MIVSSNWAFYVISIFLFLFNSIWSFFESDLPWRKRWQDVSKSRKKDIFKGFVKLAVFWAILLSASFVNVLNEDRTALSNATQERQQLVSENSALKKQNGQLLGQIGQFQVTESPKSLRRRTIKLAASLSAFVQDRDSHHPQVAYPPAPNEPPPDEERKKVIKAYSDYQQETKNQYVTRYKDQIVGIIREYQGKGIYTGWMEREAEQWFPQYVVGTAAQDTCYDLIWRLRELAYHIDGNDVPIHL